MVNAMEGMNMITTETFIIQNVTTHSKVSLAGSNLFCGIAASKKEYFTMFPFKGLLQGHIAIFKGLEMTLRTKILKKNIPR